MKNTYQNNPIIVHKSKTLEQLEFIENKRHNIEFKLLLLKTKTDLKDKVKRYYSSIAYPQRFAH